jgi:hypothetical protein
VAGGEENATSRLPYPDDVTSSRCAHNAVLADQELLDAIGSTNLSNGLGDLGVPVTTIAANNKERALNAFGDRLEDTGDERL